MRENLKSRLFTMGTQLANLVGGVGYLIGFWMLMDSATAFVTTLPRSPALDENWARFVVWIGCGILMLAQFVYLIYGRSEMKTSDTAFQWLMSTAGLVPAWLLVPIHLDPLYLTPILILAFVLAVTFLKTSRQENWTTNKLTKRLRTLELEMTRLDRRAVVHIPAHREMARIRNMIQQGYVLEAHWAIEDLQQELRRSNKRRGPTRPRRAAVVAITPQPYPQFSRLN